MPLALFTLGLMVAAVVIVWAVTRHGASAAPVRLAEARGATITVHKSPTCGCCEKWVRHMRAAGFAVTVVYEPDVSVTRRASGVPDSLASCHTAVVASGGSRYTVEGHVPAADLARLLRERPALRGVAAAGMPVGSPGMEGSIQAAYEVLGFDAASAVRLFASH